VESRQVFNLGALPGYTNSIATDINDRGQVVGYSYNRGGGFSATEWSRGDVINLGGLPGYTDSFAYAINDRGQVAGQSGNSLLSSRATEWSGGAVINLGTLPGTSGSAAFAINESGQAVGVSVTFNDADTATLWTDGSVKNLGALSPNFYSSASSINDAGQVVGWSDPDGQAALWNDGTVIDLNTDISSLYRWILTDATAINDGGQIAGYGLNPLGQYEGFLLTPCATSCPIPAIIPEPSTWAMMLLGFAGLGFTGCRGARAGSTTMLAA
jgi:probable HAF family extracellular repeat protein